MKFNIDDYKGKYVMHCKTEEEAIDFANYLIVIQAPYIPTCSLGCYYGKNVYFSTKALGVVRNMQKEKVTQYLNGVIL